MRCLVMTDLEGVAGVVSFTQQAYDNAPYLDAARSLLTAEVNAACEGLLEAGATEILVLDGHGCGGIRFEELHPEARLLHGRPFPDSARRAAIYRGYDMALMVGQHAMAGTPDGNLNHTQNSRAIEYYQLNGRAIGEIAQFALTCGAVGVPLVFLSGDAAACREAEELIPSVTTAAVKQGIGRGTAISLSGPKARQLIRNRVRTAVESHTRTPIRPLVWEAPYVLDIRFFTTDLADTHPGERIDPRTVRQRAQDILEII